MRRVRRLFLGFGLLVLAAAAAAPGAVRASSGEEDGPWSDIRAALFAGREIRDGAGVVSLEAPRRAEDAAIVPITVTAEIPQSEDRYIEAVHLIVDENPAPLAGVFHFTLDSGSASFSTRVRVNAYTNIRAVAETSDGELYMASRFVKAAGGCSAPALKDAESAMANLGRMKLRPVAAAGNGTLREAQLLISHPNYSGMQFDQISRTYVPAHFVERIDVRHGDHLVLSVDANISLSENPSIHFHYRPQDSGEIRAEVTDSEGMHFSESWPVAPPPAS